MVIDFHNHLGTTVNGLTTQTAEQLLRIMERSGIDRSVVFPIGKDAPAYREENLAIMETARHEPRLIPFARLVPKGESLADEVAEAVAAGARGIKLHVKNDGLLPEAMAPFLATVGPLGLPIIIHVHGDRAAWVRVFADHPHVTFVIAHCGGGYEPTSLAAARSLANVYLETSSCAFDHLRILLGAVAPEKILFGSDSPIHHPQVEALKLTLLATPAERELMLGANAARLLRLG